MCRWSLRRALNAQQRSAGYYPSDPLDKCAFVGKKSWKRSKWILVADCSNQLAQSIKPVHSIMRLRWDGQQFTMQPLATIGAQQRRAIAAMMAAAAIITAITTVFAAWLPAAPPAPAPWHLLLLTTGATKLPGIHQWTATNSGRTAHKPKKWRK